MRLPGGAVTPAMKPTTGFFTLLTAGQDRDISKLSSGGKLNPLQANMDIRHYTLSLNIDISKESIKGFADVDIILAKTAMVQ